MSPAAPFRLCLPLLLLPLAAPAQPAATVPASELHARLEEHEGLRILRTWGTPEERGYAHGRLLGNEIAAALRIEFRARFGRRQPLLDMARKALPRLIEYPPAIALEIDSLYRGVVDSGADRTLMDFDREFDLDDLKIANALDVFGLMGCSGFSVFGDQVEGGGVLSGRNFDWPFTGPHLIDQTIVLVQHLGDQPGSVPATASVTWPGYLGSVTGINQDGVAVFLHVGSGKITMSPEPSSWPTAIAANRILAEVGRGTGAPFAAAFDKAQELLEWTSPPAGFLTRVVLPIVPGGGSPLGLFETDSEKVVRAEVGGACVVTNHFQGRSDGREASDDSLDRQQAISKELDGCFHAGDGLVSVAEAWQMLASVQRGGGHAFGTLHSLVFRQDPWCFELRLAELRDKKLVAAPVSPRRFVLPREVLFPAAEQAR